MPVQGTHDEISRELTPLLERIDASLHAACIDAVLDALDPEVKTRRVDRSLNEKDAYYVVHDGDLDLLKNAVALGLALIPAFKPLTALPTLIGLLFRYRRKRGRIDGEQAAVLLCLRAAPPGGLTSAELTRELRLAEPLPEARVLEVLSSLREVLLADGSRSDFVVESRGYWTASDV